MSPEPTIASQRQRQARDLENRLAELSQAGGASFWRRARRMWKQLPVPAALRGSATSLYYRCAPRARARVELEARAGEMASLPPRPAEAIAPGPIVVTGFLSDATGIGRAGRQSVAALREAGFDPLPHDLGREPQGWSPSAEGGVWLAHCNAPEAAEFLLRSPAARAAYRVGYWAWELPVLPASWVKIAELFHELWAPSEFIAQAMRAGGVQIPIRMQPHPHPGLEGVGPDRARFGLPAAPFLFLSMYDVRSSASRKNPMGAVRAFQVAFAADRADVLLVLKVVSANKSRGCLDELKAAIAGWPNIRLIEETLSDEDANVLLASADAFVSLHRAEGFGLSIAQAMALGRPVVATGWSGNLDFCGPGALLVPYELTPVEDLARIYDDGDQVWAEPNLAAAAAHLRALADHRPAAQALGEAARKTVRERLPSVYETDHLRPWLRPG